VQPTANTDAAAPDAAPDPNTADTDAADPDPRRRRQP
jgi:hypothetical protein